MRVAYTPPIGWITRAQAASYLGISQWKLRELVKEHGILANRAHGTFTYRVEDIEAIARTLFTSQDDSL